MKQQELEGLADCEWYYRDKGQDEQPLLAWCATWPEGRRDEQPRANFICRLYFTAPDRDAALHEFRRWACIRMQDVPYIVLAQLSSEDAPTCPRPHPDRSGLALPDGEYRL